MRLRFGVLALFAVLLGPAVAGAEDPTFLTVKIPDSGSRQEPRIAVGPDDTRWAVALDTTDSISKVWKSKDGGQTFQKTDGDPPQTAATIDVDVATLPSGRILSTELDTGGLNFPMGYSDNGGKTWTQSGGSNMLADQDRQWLAVGPVPKGSPAGTQPPVYLLYHNLASGVAQHNMFVATSTDGGANFGPPVPVAQPGSDAYLDLQCSDSGGPSDITVNPKTGVIYAIYTTRASPTPTGQDAGGCGAPVFGQPIEFNIVNGTRVWVASSKTGALGSWTNSLAVDDSVSGQVVSMQLAYGALDNAGNVYVAYPEAPNAYPDLEGAAIKLTWQAPDSNGNLPGKWSKPTTLVAPTPHTPSSIVGGSNLVHLIAGDPGRIAVAYYYGEPVTGPLASTTTPYYPYILQSFDAQSQDPHVSRYKVSDFPAYKWSTSGMMGLCARALSTPVVGGVYAGLACNRSTDVWGIAADAQCRVMSAWAESDGTGTGGTGAKAGSAESGTFVTTQTGGPTLCAKTSSVPGGSPGIPFQPTPAQTIPGCPDQVAPNSHVTGKQVSRKQIFLSGNAIDHGCGVTGAKARARVRAVAVGVGHVIAAHKCRYLKGDGTFGPVVLCKDPSYVVASGAAKWALTLKGTFPKGQ
ncbi:MAG: repeat-like domain [Solirubrobacteraceae bacterium]|nr:repeat-like domain [Solirubrobacteraceae bacterium]